MPSVLNTEDHELIEMYYRTEAKDMEIFARNMLNSKDLAEEAVQETFSVAWSKIDKLKGSPKPVGWLYNTLKFVIMHMRRDLQKQLLHLVSMDDIPDIPVTNEEMNSTLLSDMENDPDLKLLKEFYIDGRSMIELAEDYKITVGACKMRLKRARDRWKIELE